jgi:uncharacterized peroxidase-related enzyme
MSRVIHEFTLEPVDWAPYVQPINYESATPEQRDALKITPSNLKISDFVLVLAHDVETLKHRTPLVNGILYDKGGLRRADRELGALATSIVNHCVYCASVHASRFIALTKAPQIVEAIYKDGINTIFEDERWQAVFDFSVRISQCPPTASRPDIERLRTAGLDDLEILDLVHSCAMFAWANRVMHTLGEPIEKEGG